jgi:hypothetical protein
MKDRFVWARSKGTFTGSRLLTFFVVAVSSGCISSTAVALWLLGHPLWSDRLSIGLLSLSTAQAAQAPPEVVQAATEMYKIPRCPTGYHRIGHVCRIILPRRIHHGDTKTDRCCPP